MNDLLEYAASLTNTTSTRPNKNRYKKKRFRKRQDPSKAALVFSSDKSVKRNGNTSHLRLINRLARQHILERTIDKYCATTSPYTMLDVGAGRIGNLTHCEKMGASKLFAIEPATESVNVGRERVRKHKSTKIQVTVLHGKGNADWSVGGGLGNPVEDNLIRETFKVMLNQIDIVIFNNSIQYMLKSKESLYTQLTNLAHCTVKKGIVLIVFMDGDIIHEKLKHQAQYTIFSQNRRQKLFCVKRNYRHVTKLFGNEINIFFRGVRGLSKGVAEYLCMPECLKIHFQKFGFEHVEKINMLEYVQNTIFTNDKLNKLVRNMSKNDEDIIKLYSVQIFRKL